MMTMKKLILVLILTTLTSCAYIRPHRIPIEQGNIITETDSSRLKIGMSTEEVKAIMGTPVLKNVFTPNRIDYVYYLYNGYEYVKQQKLICLFQNDRLVEIVHA